MAGVVGRSSWAPWGKVSFSCRQGRGDHTCQLSSDDEEGNQNVFWGGTRDQAFTVSARGRLETLNSWGQQN